MEPLRSGIGVYTESSDAITLSAGSILLSGTTRGGLPYITSAVVPSEPWRAPDERELELLLCDDASSVEMGRTVAVVPMLPSVVELLRQVPWPTELPPAGAPIVSEEAIVARERVTPMLRRFAASDDGFVVQGLRAQPSGLRTSTTHAFRGGVAVTGMHLDRWHHGPYGCQSHGQLSVNVGHRDRYFVFVNIPVAVLPTSLSTPADGWLTIPREFARARSSYPIVRVRIRPGEAYLAPTEAIIHDVSLEGSDDTDVCFLLRGRLQLPT